MIGAAALSGCVGSGESGFTNSQFNTPDSSGNYVTKSDRELTFKKIESDGDGISYRTYLVDYEGFTAEAGIIPGTVVAAAPVSGVVNYSGTFYVTGVREIDQIYGGIRGRPYAGSGGATLTGNFNTSKLTGSGDGLVVNGDISGGTFDGDVVWRGIAGDLAGIIGADRTVGVFHGHNDTDVYAGGFIADAR